MKKPLRVLMVEDSEDDALLTVLGAEHFGPFERAIKQYDFKKAFELIKPQAERFNKQR